jgi:hypothetical protein
MRRVSMATRDELIAALAGRYSRARRIERSRILDEFVAVTGYHRKHAMRVLRSGPAGSRHGSRPGRRIYGAAVRDALILLWEASDRVCGQRLRSLLPVLVDAMERHGRLELDPVVRAGVLAVSAARSTGYWRHGQRGTAAVALGRAPERAAGDSGADFHRLVRSAARFLWRRTWVHAAHPLAAATCRRWVLTDIASGWTECAPLLIRERHPLMEVLEKVKVGWPFATAGDRH